MKILGFSAFYHDSAAAIIQDEEILAAAQEERFTRKKHDASFPANAIKYCLEYTGTHLKELDAIAFYDKPLLKFERLLESYYAFAPRGIRSFIAAMPVWLKEKLFLKKLIYDELKLIGEFDKKKVKLLFPEHHLSHAASTFYSSPFKDSAILTIDGVGEWATAIIGHGKDNKIKVLKELKFPHSVGLFYSAFTYYLGFRVNSGEYKMMGLAPYGNLNDERVKRFKNIIKEHLIDIADDGSIWLNQKYFNYATGLTMVAEKKWEKIFGFARREAETELNQEHCDLALAVQQITEEVLLKMAQETKRLTRSENLCLAGGVALNCVANGKLLNSGIFKNIFIQPAAGDAGGALGAAQAAYYVYFGKERKLKPEGDRMKGALLGPEFSDKEIELMSRRHNAVMERIEDFTTVVQTVAAQINDGKTIGWMQGRMEFGPRALGNRSILGDPRSGKMQKNLNLKIKHRESFRPFAPSVLSEDYKEYFEGGEHSPFMLFVQQVHSKHRKDLPKDFDKLSMREKLYFVRSDIPAITHVDFSARIQTVHKSMNPKFWNLINEFKKLTECGMLVNTSFNVRGEPIVCTPEDAYRCFMRTELDILVINNYLFHKKDQPQWSEKSEWKEAFVLD